MKIFIESWKSPLLNFPMVFRVKRAKKFVKMMCGWQKHEKFRRAHIYDAAKGICQKNGMSSFFCSDMPHQNCFEDIPILKKFNENLCSRFTLWIRKLVVYTWINSLIWLICTYILYSLLFKSSPVCFSKSEWAYHWSQIFLPNLDRLDCFEFLTQSWLNRVYGMSAESSKSG